jgi:hypothetical protein
LSDKVQLEVPYATVQGLLTGYSPTINKLCITLMFNIQHFDGSEPHGNMVAIDLDEAKKLHRLLGAALDGMLSRPDPTTN